MLSLLDILSKFAEIIFEQYGLNITSCKTISGLSFKLYISNFYNKNYNIKLIKGGVEKEIWKGYYGG